MSQLDNILLHIGEFGKFQKSVYGLLNFLTILQCCQMFLLVFVADKPQWHCSEREQSLLDQDTKSQGFPCYKNGSMCQDITFSTEFGSIASEWRLICDQEYKSNLAQAIIMAGCLAGAIVFGGMADRHGRKFAIIFMQTLASVFCFASGLAQSFEQFVVLRFLCAATLTGSGMTIFVLISEILGPRTRDFLLTIHQVFYSLGYVVLTVCAYYIRDWRNLTLAISFPSVICAVFFLRSTCESPQWLLEKGKFDEGKQLLKDMAEKNGSEIPEKFLHDLTKNSLQEKPKASQGLMSVFATEGYLKKITILCMVWVFLAMMYYGLSFASKSTSNNKYISFSFSGLVEIPSLITSMFLLKSGRKMPLFYLAVFGALACLVCASLLGGETSQVGFLVTLLAMLGKFGIAACYSILYIFSAELFTATVRSFSMGICSTAASIGGILAPLVVSLEVYDKRLPMFIFGIGAICSAILVLTLPESVVRLEESDKKKE